MTRNIYQVASGYAVEKFYNPVNYNGIRIDANCGAIKTKNKARFFPYYFLNEHSIREKKLIDKYLPETHPVIEFGGGIGYISAYINNKIKDGKTQVVVEPDPDNFHCNSKTKELNHCDYKLLEGAYSSDDSKTKLSINDKFSTGSTEKTNTRDRQISVKGFSMSKICSDNDLENFVLISDMEGGEFGMIDDELDIISKSVPFMIIEFHPFDGINEKEYVSKIISSGFVQLDEDHGTYAFKNTNLVS